MTNDLHELVQEFRADLGSLSRLYSITGSTARRQRLDRLYSDWQNRLDGIHVADLEEAGRVDYILFRNKLSFLRSRLPVEERAQKEVRRFIPFADRIIDLEESRARVEDLDPTAAARTLHELKSQVDDAKAKLCETGLDPDFAFLAEELLKEVREALGRWLAHYDGYDPAFSWWSQAPYKELDSSLEAFGDTLREKAAEGPIGGRPVGREALIADLEFEMIPYAPEELIAIGQREYAWCESEMKRAASELGFGEDWMAAVEHVKTLHLQPGQQPALVRRLALEAIEFVESRNLLTVPPLAKETWRLEMMSAEKQLVNPFFLGGETIIVSFPTNAMSHAQKLMSLRGNNPHFSRATVQHELIPGHHMQGFMTDRYKPYRSVFSTPFWIEGWALYWEMLLWDLGFPQSPEDRIGMLFWRMHRCVRIAFSLKFHLGEVSAAQCVEMLVEQVGHERANAEGEVRRSFNGSYPPLYQAAYMIGGLQFRALRREMVDSGQMTDKEFHDTILKENEMPVAVLRSVLRKEVPAANEIPAWFFNNPGVV